MFKNIRKNISSFLKPFDEVNVYIEELDFIYISISKTGISSIRSMILEKFSIDFDEKNYNTIHKNTAKYFKYITKDQVIEKKDSFKYSMVRNPFDRLVSCYKNKILDEDYLPIQKGYGPLFKKEMSFEEFVNGVCILPDSLSDRHFRSQNCYLYHNEKLIVDYLGKFEMFDESVKVLQKKFDLGNAPIINKSTDRSDYKTFYTKKLLDKVYKRYKDDVIKFGYEKEHEELREYLS